MQKVIYLATLILLSTFFSCSKSDGVLGGESLIYYDYTYNTNGSFQPTTADLISNRVCYNLNSEKIIWQQVNSKYPNFYNTYAYGFASYIGSHSLDLQNQYFFNKKIGNYLIRVCTPTNKPFSEIGSFYPNNAYEGVWLQKIEAGTGNEVLLKNIIPKADFNAQNSFCISKVETDDIRIYFTCNNGFLYSFDLDGNLVWKKNLTSFPLYSPSGGTQPFSFFGLNENKIYIRSFPAAAGTSNFKIINSINGTELYDQTSNNTSQLEKFPEYFFTDKYCFSFSYVGTGAFDKFSGNTPIPFIGDNYTGNYTGGGYYTPVPIGVLSNNLIVFTNWENKLAYFDVSLNRTIPTQISCNSNRGSVFLDGVLYGGYVNSLAKKFEFSAINAEFTNTAIKWNNSFQLSNFNNPSVSKFYLSKNRLYIFTNFYIENGIGKPNKPVPERSFPSLINATGLVVLIIDASTGNLIKQCKEMPSNGTFYNIINE